MTALKERHSKASAVSAARPDSRRNIWLCITI